jgi:CheY-like chemotaxis protein
MNATNMSEQPPRKTGSPGDQPARGTDLQSLLPPVASTYDCQELAEPVHAIVTLSGLLLETVVGQDGPKSLITDLQKIHQASQRLLELVKDALPAGTDASKIGPIRHELGGALNEVSGRCQLLIAEQESQSFGVLLEDLQRINHLCQDFQQKLSQFIAQDWLAGTPRQEAAPVKVGKLLIVDNDATGREILRRLLAPQGHQIFEADSGARALTMVREQTFDLILLDLVMPGLDGFQVLQQLQAQPQAPRPPVVVISGREDTSSALRCQELGAEITSPSRLTAGSCSCA